MENETGPQTSRTMLRWVARAVLWLSLISVVIGALQVLIITAYWPNSDRATAEMETGYIRFLGGGLIGVVVSSVVIRYTKQAGKKKG
jgi:hypothetical protein